MNKEHDNDVVQKMVEEIRQKFIEKRLEERLSFEAVSRISKTSTATLCRFENNVFPATTKTLHAVNKFLENKKI